MSNLLSDAANEQWCRTVPLQHVSINKQKGLTLKICKFCKSIAGIDGIVEGWWRCVWPPCAARTARTRCNMLRTKVLPWQQSSWGQHGTHLGPVGPRWAPCWPHEPCYLGKPSKPQANPGLLHSHTPLCCRNVSCMNFRVTDLPFVRGIHRPTVDSPHKGPITFVTDVNRHLVPYVLYVVHTRTFEWPIYDFHVLVLREIPSGSRCMERIRTN